MIKEVLPNVSADYFGASGLCRLNANGDRAQADFDIWGIGVTDGKPGYVTYGYYNGLTGNVIWYSEMLGFNLLGL